MRPSLGPGLLAGAQANLARGFGDVALFEVGQVFKSDAEDGQFIAAAGLRRGTAKPTAPAAIGPARPRRWTCSTPRPM